MAKDLLQDFSTDQLLKIKEIVVESINTLLPKILKEVTPLIIQTSKNIINKELSSTNHVTVKEVDIQDEFYKHHHLEWNKLLNHRENLFYKHERNDQLLELYEECLAEEPIYIPRKFRNDKYHVNTVEERNIVMKSNIQKLQSECEILKLRRDNFASDIIKQDEKIGNFINNVSSNTCLKNELNKIHNEEINRDMQRIKTQRNKKNISTKEAFKRDKTKYFELYKDILPPQQNHSEENNQNEHIDDLNEEIETITHVPPQHTNNSPSKNEVHRYPKRKKHNQQF